MNAPVWNTVRIFTSVFTAELLMIAKEAGPETFVHCQALIFLSGSLDLLPSSNTLSAGKVMTTSGPAAATGGLLFSLHSSHTLCRKQIVQSVLIRLLKLLEAVAS